ncbi:hypothetical protein L21SP5_02916 [Salinivirga cyanobacteriivorans]|uniref:Uncharacterized protein n=1 Tax=Salinivirga cyanobacteriivorans TaxID=1307839 RepID=A0A0S2I285_9BACT|nr:hypothetical protein [Salinivirga cyanobacteriivorans]ALO16536.1 hypothetical protein L21SP5_02916 [Salinivirga cyanobacteriivorans]
MEKKFIERYGSLKKIEPLKSITDDAVLPNTLAFECPSPFPGYYGSKPTEEIPLYVYFILDGYFHLEDLLLIKEDIKKVVDFDFHATICALEFFDETFNAIRVRHVEDYAKLRKLQQLFVEHGIHFHKKSRKYKYIEDAFIRIKKFFQLEEIEPGLFFDLVEHDHGYIKIDQHLEMNDFLEIARQVDYNLDIIDYDAALASYFEDYKVHDMIRIYTEKISKELLQNIKVEYEKKIKKLLS